MVRMMMLVVVVAALAGTSLGSPLSKEYATPLLQGQDLRLHELYETTSWPFLEDCYNQHNGIRKQHSVNEIKLNRTLVDYARLKALILAWYDGNPPQEKEATMFGENTFWSEGAQGPVDCGQAVAAWYAEGSQWNYQSPGPVTEENRHFAQLVWKSSRRFGCGQSLSRGPRGGVYTVCYYDPTPVLGKEQENVLPPTAPAPAPADGTQ